MTGINWSPLQPLLCCCFLSEVYHNCCVAVTWRHSWSGLCQLLNKIDVHSCLIAVTLTKLIRCSFPWSGLYQLILAWTVTVWIQFTFAVTMLVTISCCRVAATNPVKKFVLFRRYDASEELWWTVAVTNLVKKFVLFRRYYASEELWWTVAVTNPVKKCLSC